MVESLYEIGAASAADHSHRRAFAAGQGLEGRFGSGEWRLVGVLDDFGEGAVEITGNEQRLVAASSSIILGLPRGSDGPRRARPVFPPSSSVSTYVSPDPRDP